MSDSEHLPRGLAYYPDFITEPEKLYQSLLADEVTKLRYLEDPLGTRHGRHFGTSMRSVVPNAAPPKELLPPEANLIDTKIEDFTPMLKGLAVRVGDVAQTEFDTVLVQRFGPFDLLRYHRDASLILGPEQGIIVASLSLGSTRWMSFRNAHNQEGEFGFELEPGSLVVMSGDFQSRYAHSILGAARPDRDRVSLTFLRYARQDWEERSPALWGLSFVPSLNGGAEKNCFVGPGTRDEIDTAIEQMDIPVDGFVLLIHPVGVMVDVFMGAGLEREETDGLRKVVATTCRAAGLEPEFAN